MKKIWRLMLTIFCVQTTFLLFANEIEAHHMEKVNSTFEISGFSIEDRYYIITTIELMNELNFKIRDTFHFDRNLDDFYSNGRRYNGKRFFHINWVNLTASGYTEISAQRAYTIAGYSSHAYDSFRMSIPQKHKNPLRQDIIIHECTHFLQHATLEDEKNYINYNGKNYNVYIKQRTEIEAHLVQIYYICKTDNARMDKYLSIKEQLKLKEMISGYIKKPNVELGVQIILMCKNNNLI